MKEIFAYDRIGDQPCERAPLTEKELAAYILEPQDLLFARQSLTFEGAGKCSIYEGSSEPRTWEGHLIRASLDPVRTDSRYYYHYFRSPNGRHAMSSIVQQVAAAGIRGSDLARLEVPVPPLGEQRAIAEVLGALDDKIAANSRQASTAAELAQMIYTTEVAGSPSEPMSEVLTPVLGGTPARARADYWSGERPWVSAKDVTGAWFGMVFETEEQITDLAVAETKAKPLPSGGVILTARGTVGAVARVTQPTSFNQSCYGFVPGRVPAACLYFAVVEATSGAKQMAHGSVFDTITKRTFDHLAIPSLTVERWGAVEATIEPLLSLTESLGRESGQLARTRDALLPGLMSGKIRVKDAERVVEEVV